MFLPSALQYAVFLLIVLLLVKPAGGYLARVFGNEKTLLDPVLRPIENRLYRLFGVRPKEDMSWETYAGAFLLFSLFGTALLYGVLRLQNFLPGGPNLQSLPTPMTPDLAMNTAVSFSTTTTWQAYGGETTMRYATQMIGLAAQNFLAGASGLAVGIAFARGFAREKSAGLGNFYVDVTRALLYVLIPLSLIGSVALVALGVPMNWAPYAVVTTMEGASQTIPGGPVAALEFIKNLGTNGGGFFNVNGAHPFECPNPLANLVEMLAIAALPASLTYTFGKMLGRPRLGGMLLAVMTLLFVGGLLVCGVAEQTGNPQMHALGVTGGNYEGKETRFGIGGSALAAIVTSNGATGSYNSMYDSYTPLGGGVLLVNMLLGEIVYGGLGTGLYSIVMIALVGLFLGGLMIGRTPEFVGKTLGPQETKLILLYTLATPIAVLLLTAVAVVSEGGLAGLTTNDGPHGFSEILYAYASATTNNGQNMAGLSANTPFYNITTAIAMMAGRFGLAIPALALAGRFAAQGRRPTTTGTLPTDTVLFAIVLIGTALIVGALTFLPALALGPLVEHFQMTGK